MHSRSPIVIVLTVLAAAPLAAVAADAHVGVHPKHGEMVLLRDVSARPAYRPAPPGIALIVDPTPTRELADALGTGELSDDDFAALSSGQQLAPQRASAAAPGALAGQVLSGTLGRATGEGGALSGSGFGRTIGVPMGAVGNATRGIGDHINSALAQFPLGATTTGGQGSGP